MLNSYSKTRLAFNSLSNRISKGESEGNAANQTGIEFTHAAEVGYRILNFETIKSSPIFIYFPL